MPLLLTIPQHSSLCCFSLICKPLALVQKLLAQLSRQKAFATTYLATGYKVLVKCLSDYSVKDWESIVGRVHLPWLCVSFPEFTAWFLFLFFFHWYFLLLSWELYKNVIIPLPSLILYSRRTHVSFVFTEIFPKWPKGILNSLLGSYGLESNTSHGPSWLF